MKVKLLSDAMTPEGWIGEETKRAEGLYFEEGQIVEVIPATNMPDDYQPAYWIAEPGMEDHAYGILLSPGDYELVEEEERPKLFSTREVCTIIAALRMYQCELALGRVGEWFDIASDGGLIVDPLDEDEIDTLCERFNSL